MCGNDSALAIGASAYRSTSQGVIHMRVIREPTACYAAFREDLAVVKGRDGVLDLRGCLQNLSPQGFSVLVCC